MPMKLSAIRISLSRLFIVILGLTIVFAIICSYSDIIRYFFVNSTALKFISNYQPFGRIGFLSARMNETTPIPITHQNTPIKSKTIPIKLTTTSVTAAKTVTTTTTTSTTTTTPTPKTTTPISTTKKPYICSFPIVDPLDPDIRKYVEKYGPLKCKGMPSLVYRDGDTLRLNKTKVAALGKSVDFCQYHTLALAEKNDLTYEGPKKQKRFVNNITLPRNDHEHVFVECKFSNSVVGESFFVRIIDKPDVEKRSEERYTSHLKNDKPAETLSVLIVGMDGMSKQNLIRTMPQTRNFIINEMNAKEMNSFNKVGDNTYPNVITLFTGHHEEELEQFNGFKTHRSFFDVIEDKMIWHDYQKAGYRTGMMFDSLTGTAFHYLKKGWKKPTFDYYNRPIPLFMRKQVKKKYGTNCDGDKPEIEIMYDYWLQLLSRFNNTKTKPYFGYSFMGFLSHDNQNEASMGDDLYLNLFKEIKSRNVLNNTLLIFFSDHGMRFGRMMHTFNGKIEARSPFFFFMFPPWFEKKYPKEMANFYVNQNRLATNFDVHATLLDLLNFKGKKHNRTLTGISLFDEIPRTRTCTDAKIPTEYCLCSDMSKNVSKEMTNELAKQFLDIINERTSKHRDVCAILRLKSILTSLKLKNEKTTKENSYFQLSIEATPGGGTFEASLRYNSKTGKASLVGNIVRLNLYRGQDFCVHTLDLKPYCYCKSS